MRSLIGVPRFGLCAMIASSAFFVEDASAAAAAVGDVLGWLATRPAALVAAIRAAAPISQADDRGVNRTRGSRLLLSSVFSDPRIGVPQDKHSFRLPQLFPTRRHW